MIRRNFDFIALLVLLAGIAATSQVRRTVEIMPAAMRASDLHRPCPTLRALASLPFFRAVE